MHVFLVLIIIIKKKDPSSAFTATTNASKKVVDVEVKVGLATWSASEGGF